MVDDIFGSPAGPSSQAPGATNRPAGGGDGGRDEGGGGGGGVRPRAGTDDFHAHDADTREMLDFLDVEDSASASASGVGGGGGGEAAAAMGAAGGGGNVDDILGELDVVREEPESGGASPPKPSKLSARATSAPASVASSARSLLSVDTLGSSGRAEKDVAETAPPSAEASASPAESSGSVVEAAPGAASDPSSAIAPNADAAASDGSVARPTIVALPPTAETRVGQGRTSALLQSSSDVTDDVEGAVGDNGSTVVAGRKAAATGATKKKKKAAPPPPPPPPPKFDTLSEAVRSPLSTLPQLRDLCLKGGFYDVKAEDRPRLWCKAACGGKTLDDVSAGSVAASFLEWDAAFEKSSPEKGNEKKEETAEEIGEGGKETNDPEAGMGDDGATQESEETKEGADDEQEDAIVGKVRDEATSLAQWVSRGTLGTSSSSNGGDAPGAEASAARAIRSLLLFHYHSAHSDEEQTAPQGVGEGGSDVREDEKKDGDTKSSAVADGKKAKKSSTEAEWDPLLGPVTATLLSSGMSPAATSVVLSHLMPSSLPLMALTGEERTEATRSLHGRLYLLACYHLPLLVLHLDRYAPGWHWPKVEAAAVQSSPVTKENDTAAAVDGAKEQSATEKSRDLLSRGTIPPSWFVSHLAGGGVGSDGTPMLEPSHLQCLWDVLLTNGDQSLKFFLALAALEKHSDALLMLRGDELTEALCRAMSLCGVGGGAGGGFVGDDDDEDDEGSGKGGGGDALKARDHRSDVKAWHDRARSLAESTPSSVLSELRSAEDEAVSVALQRRRRVAEEKMQARLDEEARRHREALEGERRRAAEEARAAMVRARLVAFYQRHSPDKVGNVDRILTVYDGRTNDLDKKLREKYGEGFLPKLPAINPNLSAGANKLLSTMNLGLQTKRRQIAKAGKTWRARRQGGDNESGFDLGNNVAVRVSAAEVLPVLCAGHGGKVAAEKDAKDRMRSTTVQQSSPGSDNPLHFYLVDSRPDETAGEQGRFPTATILSPEALMDPDRIQQQVEVFESLRGAVHIVVMGEGFSFFPRLYDHRISAKEKALAEEDDSRTSLCALFFIKKGFPFVSILDGGFAAAHAWLARDGPKRGLSISSILVDYEQDTSLFAQLEDAYREQQELANASAKEKTTRTLQKLMDKSLTGLTVTENRIENFYAEMASSEGREKVKQSMSKLFERDITNSGGGTTRIAPDVNMSLKAAALRDGFSSLRERVSSTTATKTTVSASSSPAESSAASSSAPPQSTGPPSVKPGAARDYGPPRDDNQANAAPSQSSVAGESIKNAMARFRATIEEKKVGSESAGDVDSKNDKEGIKGAMARFRATLEEKKDAIEGKDSQEKKTREGEGIKNAMARFRTTLDAKSESGSKIRFSGLSQTFAAKKEAKDADGNVDGEEKNKSTSSQGSKEEDRVESSERGSTPQGGVLNSLSHAGRPQFGTMLKNPFAGKTDSSEDSTKSTSALPASERFSKMLKNTSNPFATKDEGGGRDENKTTTSESSDQRPQLNAVLFRKIRSRDAEGDELTKTMKEALEGDDTASFGGISTAASAAGTRMKSAFGSVKFSQKGLGVSSLASSTGNNQVSSNGSGDVGLGAFRKKMSDIAASRKEKHEEESISFDLEESSEVVNAENGISALPSTEKSVEDKTVGTPTEKVEAAHLNGGSVTQTTSEVTRTEN